MPLYDYECGVCSHITADLREIKDRNKIAICEKCGCVAVPIISHFNVVTDTNFLGTGIVDKRLGERPIEGRKDYEQRLKEKGLVEISNREVLNDTGDREAVDFNSSGF